MEHRNTNIVHSLIFVLFTSCLTVVALAFSTVLLAQVSDEEALETFTAINIAESVGCPRTATAADFARDRGWSTGNDNQATRDFEAAQVVYGKALDTESGTKLCNAENPKTKNDRECLLYGIATGNFVAEGDKIPLLDAAEECVAADAAVYRVGLNADRVRSRHGAQSAGTGPSATPTPSNAAFPARPGPPVDKVKPPDAGAEPSG